MTPRQIVDYLNKTNVYMDEGGILFSEEIFENFMDSTIAFYKLPMEEKHDPDYISGITRIKGVITEQEALKDFAKTIITLNVYLHFCEKAERFELCQKILENIKIEMREQLYVMKLLFGPERTSVYAKTIVELKNIARKNSLPLIPIIEKKNPNWLVHENS